MEVFHAVTQAGHVHTSDFRSLFFILGFSAKHEVVVIIDPFLGRLPASKSTRICNSLTHSVRDQVAYPRVKLASAAKRFSSMMFQQQLSY